VKESATPYVALGLLTYEPMTGYEIRTTIEQSIGQFWSESFGQLYPTLRGLVDAGDVTVGEPEGPRGRRVYTVTAQGRERLIAWLARPTPTRPGPRDELLLRLFFGHLVPPETLRRQVQERRDALAREEERLDALADRLHGEAEPESPYWLLTVDHGRSMVRAGRDWCDRTLRHLEGDR